ncbi:MAG: glycerate kinase [Thiothrix sp.]|jgi:glycerate kinase|nr:MAG: glycerate kinase [Thiothrix sp.]
MKVIFAPDSFKESLSAPAVAAALARGFQRVIPQLEAVLLPVADGGEGTTEALVSATGGQLFEQVVTDPLGRPITAQWGLLGGQTEPMAVIETAAASGLHLLTLDERNPCLTSTFGTGELVRAALDAGVRRFIIGLGGSATNDAGAGFLQALGAQLLDQAGQALRPGGLALSGLQRIDLSQLDPRLASCRFEVACDVNNPLTGIKGASAVFGPQKGADAQMVAALDAALSHFAKLAEPVTGRDFSLLPGAGAAGGLGAALTGFLNAELRSGIDIVLDALDFDSYLNGAQLVITGEGRIDSQTIHGKTPIGVARRAKRQGLPVVAVAGSVSADAAVVYQHGIDAVFSIMQGVATLPQALQEASSNLERTAESIARLWQISTATSK